MKKTLFIIILFAACKHPESKPSIPEFHAAVVSFGPIIGTDQLYVIHATNDNWKSFVDIHDSVDYGFGHNHLLAEKEKLCEFVAMRLRSWNDVVKINALFDSLADKTRKPIIERSKMDTACVN